jgi:hypothetical protein
MDNTMRDVVLNTPALDSIQLRVIALGSKSAGGANNAYQIQGFDRKKNGQYCMNTMGNGQTIYFQDGPVINKLPNGFSMEALTSVLIDRLEGFQAGPYACEDNQEALDAYKLALSALQRRSHAMAAKNGIAPTPEWDVPNDALNDKPVLGMVITQ